MKTRARVTIAATLVLALLAPPGKGALLAQSGTLPGAAPKILVGLFRATGFTLSSTGALALMASLAGGQGVLAKPLSLPANTDVTVTASGTNISWEAAVPGAAPLRGVSAGPVLMAAPVETSLPPGTPGGPDVIAIERQTGAGSSFTGVSVHGSILVIPPSGDPPGGLLAANIVDMEDYLQSVVGGEIPDGWPIECLRAQAIAARSYAAYKVGLNRAAMFRDYEKDFATVTAASVLLWASDQVYRGIGEENPESVRAALDTRGGVLTYGGSPIAAYFHSDAGGMTEDPRYVWGGTVPYLQAVREVPHDSPYASWTVTLDERSLAAGLDRLGIELLAPPDIIAGYGPGASGRWSGVAVPAATGVVRLKPTDFRGAFPQVRSMLFSSFARGGGKETRGQIGAEMSVYVQAGGAVAPSVKVGSCVVLGGGGAIARNPRGASVVSAVVDQSPPTYVIQGAGWGHGVGLSQYGAKAMALAGQDAAAILRLYFQGTALEDWW